YLYRAVDKAGETVDFYLSRRRDVNAAKAFLRKAMKGQRGTGQDNSGRVRGLPSGGS
ncbi:MAG: DDE-type integrase/transposase/recombinase, partial [Acidobacteria bacterium]|nr:DDE-type integrase/transposase/recombinase [Acidobacteriota bacterium]